ncbi:MAG: ATP-NAD kinase family protein [Woeseiaceae bacterium]|jgi:predicted polyphosphate/ATP-dependent NAD kinase|nr:ATP-NAD kinase family protein [Woeseiaceae bacterium]
MRTVGLIVNPVAGMGGSVGLKGTDGAMFEEAVALGARPVSPLRVAEFFHHVERREALRLLVAPGVMGADHAKAAGIKHEVVGAIGDPPRAEDTRRLATALIEAGAELLVFAGGDGTARDVADAVGLRVPVVAIPSGVKVYSAVFCYTPQAAAELLEAFIDGADTEEAEVLDIDEDAFRAGRVDARHYGYLLVPEVERLLQGGKEASSGASPEVRRELAAAVAEELVPGTLYLLGSGTTVRAVADALGVEKTLLGVDAVLDGKLVGADLNEQAILELLDRYERAVVVVTPLGGNGFIFGRGNKQFTPEVLRRVGRDNIVVIADRAKLMQLPALHVDTGDSGLDEVLSGYIDVVVGRGHSKMMRVM